MSQHHQSDGELHDALGLVTEGFAPPGPDLVLRAAARGRKLRRTRRSQWAVAAVLVVGTAGLGLGRFTVAAGPAPTPPAASPTVSAPATPARSPAPTYRPAIVPRTGPLAEQLAALLPSRGTVTVGTSDGGFTDGKLSTRAGKAVEARAGLVFTDGPKAGAVSIELAVPVDLPDRARMCVSDQLLPPQTCAYLADGSTVVTSMDTVGSTGPALRWSVTAVRSDSRVVSVTQYNRESTTEPGHYSEMPLTLDEMTGLALSSHWGP
ncbi:hypothetical protein [Kitasatospora sp. P5_F3]